MAVSGLPEPCHDNAKHICELALGMMELSQNLEIDGEQVQVKCCLFKKIKHS